jgi:hypothetical protein
MLRPILRYGADVLHRPAAPVSEITPEIQQIIDGLGRPAAITTSRAPFSSAPQISNVEASKLTGAICNTTSSSSSFT